MRGLAWTSCAGACLPKRDRGTCERRAARLDLSLNTDGRRCRPGRAGQEAERQKRDDDLQWIELGNSGIPSVTFQPYGLRERHSRTLRRPRPLDRSGITLQPYDGHLDFGCLPSDKVIAVLQHARQYLCERAGKGAADRSVEHHWRVDPQPKCGFECGKYFGDIGLGCDDLKSACISAHTHLGVNRACRHDHDRKRRRGSSAPIQKPTLQQAAWADCFTGHDPTPGSHETGAAPIRDCR
jgi:hypothetical protein